jgi:hypothetical protein
MRASESNKFMDTEEEKAWIDARNKKIPSKVENLGSTSSSSLTQELLACCC